MNIDEKLYRVRFNIDPENPHIAVDKEKCKKCHDKICLSICPAEVFKLDGDEVSLSWEGCMECGTCRISCPEGAVEWQYPRGGYGVCFGHG